MKRSTPRVVLYDNKLIVPFSRTNFMKNNFSYRGAVPWNSLSCIMKNTLSLFK